MAVKKRKKKGGDKIRYHGKATDGYDPYKSDGDWQSSGEGSEGTSGGGMGGKHQRMAKGSAGYRTAKSKGVASKPASTPTTPSKPAPKPKKGK